MSEHFYRKAWSTLIAFFWPLILLSAFFGFWALNTSADYITPRLWSYDAETGIVTFHRNVKSRVEADFTHEIITADGLECSVSGRTFYDPGSPTKFPAPEALKPCLEAPAYRQVASWRVLLFGVIPLLPVELVQTKP